MESLAQIVNFVVGILTTIVQSPAMPAAISGAFGHLILDALTALVKLDVRVVRLLAFVITFVLYALYSKLFAEGNLRGANAAYALIGGFLAVSWDHLETLLERRAAAKRAAAIAAAGTPPA